MYLIKIKGTDKIPDYLQIRDESLNLIAYFKITNPKPSLTRCGLLHMMDEILRIAKSLKYGKIQKLEL